MCSSARDKDKKIIMSELFTFVATILIELNSAGSKFRDGGELIYGPSEIAIAEVRAEGESGVWLSSGEVSHGFEQQ